MSRLAQKPLAIPNGVTVVTQDSTVTINGPKGSIEREMHPFIGVSVGEEGVSIEKKKETRLSRALVGTTASHLLNMITGVTQGFERKLIIEGVGYRGEMEGNAVKLRVGFSHPVVIPVPDGLDVKIEKNVITIGGINKELVGGFSAKVRAVKKPEPYKGKGIRYDDEVVRRKAGKSK